MLATLFTTLLLVHSSIDVLREHHLETPEGRVAFLEEKLRPYVMEADALNQEIIALSQQVTEKIALMNERLPVLNIALEANRDFAQIDEILSAEALAPEQQEVADRIAHLCNVIDPQELRD